MRTKTTKSNVPKEVHLQRFSIKNRTLYLGYEKWLDNHPKKYQIGTKSQMSNNALNLLAAYPDINADSLDMRNIEEFVGGVARASSNNNKINYTKNFLVYLVENGTELSFSPDVLNGYLFKNNEVKDDFQEERQPLTIEQIILIRNVFKTDYVRLFVFEMVYQYGLKLNELHQCIEKNYDFENRNFQLKGRSEPLQVNERIHQIIVNNKKVLKLVNSNTNQDRLSEIGKKLQELGLMDRLVRWKDVDETRNVNFFKCPRCREIYENTPDNWALIQYESDETETKWIVCKKTCSQGASR
ncbi:hypothetical protein GC098_14075 [Paenibacillus sp. LMG 31458]|uniref:Tyr recombinase domain-containing protein n=1 Tax=Paenibacillus phytorum TaxID=2654977 RepID=A0ABX1XVG3_9BACL|nr:hypothetical protein [Paenibacillus phytorum]NOU72540.1 hypothetical protein [Paenibacillus phytorum]